MTRMRREGEEVPDARARLEVDVVEDVGGRRHTGFAQGLVV